MKASTEFLIGIITALIWEREGKTFEYRANHPEGLSLDIRDDRDANCIRLTLTQDADAA